MIHEVFAETRKTVLIDQCAAPLVKTEFKNRGAGFPKSGFHSLLLLPPNQVSSALKRSIELFVYFRLFLSGWPTEGQLTMPFVRAFRDSSYTPSRAEKTGGNVVCQCRRFKSLLKGSSRKGACIQGGTCYTQSGWILVLRQPCIECICLTNIVTLYTWYDKRRNVTHALNYLLRHHEERLPFISCVQNDEVPGPVKSRFPKSVFVLCCLWGN